MPHSSLKNRNRISEEVECSVTVAVYCAVYLPVVQPPLRVLEVLSFLGSPGGRNRDKVDCTQGFVYSKQYLLCAIQYVNTFFYFPLLKNSKSICITHLSSSVCNINFLSRKDNFPSKTPPLYQVFSSQQWKKCSRPLL